MPFSANNVFARDDTFFGVCQALGEDLGFNPNYLRIALALPLLYAPVATIAAYLALAVLVAFTRLIVREPRRIEVEEPMPDQLDPAAEEENEPLPIAA